MDVHSKRTWLLPLSDGAKMPLKSSLASWVDRANRMINAMIKTANTDIINHCRKSRCTNSAKESSAKAAAQVMSTPPHMGMAPLDKP